MDNNATVPEVQRSNGNVDGYSILRPIDDMTKFPTEKVEAAWNHIKNQDILFDDFARRKGVDKLFLAQLFGDDSKHFELADWGWADANNILPGCVARIDHTHWGVVNFETVVKAGIELCHYLFKHYDLNRVQTFVPSFNKRAERLALAVGFKFEGVLRELFLYKGVWYDVSVYGMLRSEFEKKQGEI